MQYVALLRGINVGGNRKLPMADLRQCASDLGFGAPRTLLQSGNLLFETRKRPTAQLEQLLESESPKRLRLHVDYMVRSQPEWHEIVRGNPFDEAARRDPGHLLVMFLKQPVSPAAIDAIARLHHGPETMKASGRELYIVFPNGVGRSRFPLLLTEARLGSRCTGRNWNTVLKLDRALAASG